MRILFVSSGNAANGIGAVVKNQADTLIEYGLILTIYGIEGKGYLGYLKNIFKLRKHLKHNKYDIIHAHYSNCLIVSYLAKRTEKLGVSFMGSDILRIQTRSQKIILIICKRIAKMKCDFIIVKTSEMAKVISSSKTSVIANGVSLKDFYPLSKDAAREKLGIEKNVKLIIFVSNPLRPEKNYKLALEAYEKLKTDNNNSKIKLLPVYNIAKENLKYYYNAADILLLTSLHEGGVNVVKEAMACNCPIVATNVGDVEEVIRNTEGCFITEFDADDVANKIEKALMFNKRTNGNDRILVLGFDSEKVADKIINIYNKVIK